MKADEDSLTSLLSTPALRAELALLVALCTDEMRRNILSNFPEPAPIGVNASQMAPRPLALMGTDLIDFIDEEEEAQLATENRRQQRERDLASPQMQGMKRAALSFFDAWRLSVLRRLGEVLSVSAQAVRQRRGEYNAKADAEARKRRTDVEQGNDFANGLLLVKTVPTTLSQLEETKRSKILLCLLLLTLSLEHYAAHTRELLRIVAASLLLPASTLSDLESTVSHGLLSAAATMSAEESTKKEAAENAVGRRWKVGLATVAGAALIGVTGGLAAPFLAAGIGTVMGGLGLSIPLIGGYLGAMAGSSILIGGLFGSYGGRMTGRMMEKYAKEVEDFSFIPLKEIPGAKGELEAASDLGEAEQSTHKLRVAIGISGWLVDDLDIIAPWKVFRSSNIESFALRWEVSSLHDLGISITKVLKSYAWSAAKLELVRRTIFASLFAGLWPLGLLKIARVLDNPYSVAKARSDKAGRVLAQALLQKVQGERPVTLVGYSLGARVIYQALMRLAEQNAFGLVESVVMIGLPAPSAELDWRKIRAVVAGRLINVYSQEDYILGFLYRTSSLQYGVAGLEGVVGVDRIENYDATELMDGKGHAQYRYTVGQILRQIGVEDVNTDVIDQVKNGAWNAEERQGSEDLIPTEKLLTATELSKSCEAQIMENSKALAKIRHATTPTPENVTTIGRPGYQEEQLTADLPNAKVVAPPSISKAAESSSAKLIDGHPESAQRTPTASESEESDEDLDHRIAMIDLDPEPIL